MVWWVAPAMMAGSSALNYLSGSAQNKNQREWNKYNSQMQYGVDMANIKAQETIAQTNAYLTNKAADFRADQTMDTAVFNAGQMEATMLYNDDLMKKELGYLWEGIGLDLKQLDMQRARESGLVVAAQAASGTIIGEGSNADILIDAKTQANLDSFVVRHGADIQASKINNARAKGLWEGGMAIKKTIWEGGMIATADKVNAGLQSIGTIVTSNIRSASDTLSANFGLNSSITQADMQYNSNQTKLTNNLTTGLFSAGSMGVTNYYDQLVPQTNVSFGGAASSSGSGSYSGMSSNYQFGTGYSQNYSLLGGGQ